MPTTPYKSTVSGLVTAFHDAVELVAASIRAIKSDEGTSISSFGDYLGVLQRADKGALEVLTHDDRRYVVLAEKQFVALAQILAGQPTVGDPLAGVPRLPATEDRPRVYSVNAPNHLRLPA